LIIAQLPGRNVDCERAVKAAELNFVASPRRLGYAEAVPAEVETTAALLRTAATARIKIDLRGISILLVVRCDHSHPNLSRAASRESSPNYRPFTSPQHEIGFVYTARGARGSSPARIGYLGARSPDTDRAFVGITVPITLLGRADEMVE
jgi:hypothetical protein